MKKVIFTDNAPKAIGPYSQGTAVENFVFTSGQLPINPATGQKETDVTKATIQSLENLKAVLEEAGSGLANVIKTTVFISDMINFAEINKAYETYFNENPPARSCVEVARLPQDAVVEIEAIAYKG